jgi:MinD-like ATPase involved in chromosome partitioning or flagellar assembly
MATIISVHSFRGGTGKSNTTANLSTLLAADGHRVGVIDTDIQSPGIHVLFGLAGEEISTSLNDYLWHGRDIEDVAQDVTSSLDGSIRGKLFLIPSSIKPGEIARVLREGYDAQRLTEGLRRLVTELRLDVLMIDTHPGLNEETLLSLVLSDSLLIVMRPDRQDYEGTGITARVAQSAIASFALPNTAIAPPAGSPAGATAEATEVAPGGAAATAEASASLIAVTAGVTNRPSSTRHATAVASDRASSRSAAPRPAA